jgi:hypothetical protein
MKRTGLTLVLSVATVLGLASAPAGAATPAATASTTTATATTVSTSTSTTASTTASTSTSTATSYDVAAATATPVFQCNDVVCGVFTGYTYDGNGTCSAGCAGFPSGPADVSLGFDVSRLFPPSPCMMKSGTGIMMATWPDDPSLPVAQGTFTFKARDSHVVVFSGSITFSTLAAVPVGEALSGFVTFPPSPCTGGTAQAGATFGG